MMCVHNFQKVDQLNCKKISFIVHLGEMGRCLMLVNYYNGKQIKNIETDASAVGKEIALQHVV